MATNLTSKGQVTVPKTVRDYLGLNPGKGVTVERLDGGEIAIHLDLAATFCFFPRLAGSLRLPRRPSDLLDVGLALS